MLILFNCSHAQNYSTMLNSIKDKCKAHDHEGWKEGGGKPTRHWQGIVQSYKVLAHKKSRVSKRHCRYYTSERLIHA